MPFDERLLDFNHPFCFDFARLFRDRDGQHAVFHFGGDILFFDTVTDIEAAALRLIVALAMVVVLLFIIWLAFLLGFDRLETFFKRDLDVFLGKTRKINN